MGLSWGRVNVALKKNIGSMIMRFEPILGMQIQRNGMGYVSKKPREIIVLCRINLGGVGCISIKMLRYTTIKNGAVREVCWHDTS